MTIKIAEYEIKDGEVEIVLQAIKEFTTAIRQSETDTFYEAYQGDNSLAFVHLMKFSGEAPEDKHASATYTKKFVDIFYPRCRVEPRFTKLTSLGQ